MKLPFSIATKFLLRMVLPGFILAIFLLPVANLVLPFLGFAIDPIAVIPVLILLCGWLIMSLDMAIYMLYEGRRYWPEWLWEYFLHRESQRLSRLVTISDEHSPRTEKYQKAAPRLQRRYLRRYQEAWVERRQFPMKSETGEYRVVAPTRLGNLIAAYEEYSLRCYGLDSVFFWYRIWMKLPNDLRHHLDDQQALADSGIYVSFSLSVSTFLMILYSIISMWGYHAFQASEKHTPIWLYPLLYFGTSISLGLAAYITYRFSLQAQAQFGELFKAAFDQFGLDQPFGNVPKNIDRINLHQKIDYSDLADKNMALWRYLHNFRIRLPWNNSLIPVSQWNAHLEDCNLQEEFEPHLKVDGICKELEDLPHAVVICSGLNSREKHCQITIAFSKKGKATCPYCGTQFLLSAE